MKKSFIYFPGLCLIAIIVIIACKKKSNDVNGTTQSLNQLFSELKDTAQNFTVIAGTYQTLQGSNGTVIKFYPNSFQDASGSTITTGIINLQIIEMTSLGDMIANRVTTIENGNLLSSSGELYIYASMAGKQVFASKYSLAFPQPNASTQPMKLYYGKITGDSVISWNTGDDSASSTIVDTNHQFGNTNNYYVYDSCSNFGWVNSDDLTHIDPSAPRTTVSITIPDKSFNTSNTEIFIAFPQKKCVINIVDIRDSSYVTTNAFILNDDGNTIPVGLNYEIVIIAKKNSFYYYYQGSGVTTNNFSLNITPYAETRNDIIMRLAGL